jgi:hypothetical protein
MVGPYVRALSGVLWFVSASHFVIGAGVNLVPGSLPFFATLYGAEVNWSPELIYILKPLGAFMLALALIAAAAARNPLRCRPVVYGFVALFVIRSLQRFAFGQEISDVFGIEAGRNILNAVFFLALAGIMVGLERAASRSESTT